MNSITRYAALVTSGLMLISGVTYFVIKNWAQSEDPFSVVNHPFEPLALKTHVLVGPVLIFIFGLLFQSHVSKKLLGGSTRGRVGGVLAGVLFSCSVLSGYSLQTLVDSWWRGTLVYVHLVSGGGFCAVFVFHYYFTRRQGRERVRTETETERLAA